MPQLIDKPQLQATAQVTKSYILDQDTANVNTIINALQQSGGGGTKQEGIITTTGDCYDNDFTVTYNGDAPCIYCCTCTAAGYVTYSSIHSGDSYHSPDLTTNWFWTEATDNFTAAVKRVWVEE